MLKYYRLNTVSMCKLDADAVPDAVANLCDSCRAAKSPISASPGRYWVPLGPNSSPLAPRIPLKGQKVTAPVVLRAVPCHAGLENGHGKHAPVVHENHVPDRPVVLVLPVHKDLQLFPLHLFRDEPEGLVVVFLALARRLDSPKPHPDELCYAAVRYRIVAEPTEVLEVLSRACHQALLARHDVCIVRIVNVRRKKARYDLH
mmetsp:Transcript_12343/g.37645  ORF Transcript_12343/g.37645 Transcript_12343/m.37645 type:complete len:202 (+) Transcript_12343:872-1477(+)